MSSVIGQAADDDPAPPSRGRGGRPTRAEQVRRHEALLDAALDIFLERGFEQATVEEIATRVGMSKRTVYARHQDKAALFEAAVHRAIQRYTVPRAALERLVVEDLQQTLTAIARLRIANVAMPVSVKLQRILSAQAYRFPGLFQAAFEEGAGPAVEVLAELFADRAAKGAIQPLDPRRTAAAFLSLVVGGPARQIVAGQTVAPDEIETAVSFAVHLFLNGLRPR